MIGIKELGNSILQLLFPHTCAGCGSDVTDNLSSLCIRCLSELPYTGFENYSGNPIEKIFWGRVNIQSAASMFYFTKGSVVQDLIHELKYNTNRQVGLQLGRMMGDRLIKSKRFPADVIIPLPLFRARERQRGYNQSMLLSEGISEVMRIPVESRCISRPHFTSTQTKKGRVERWKNIEGKFRIDDETSIRNRHILLVDDVITTGATLESCATSLLTVPGVELSIVTCCFASR